jgi:hypothetical protein
MATARQVEANRQNALKSTGPTSPEGKEAVRFNALRSGVRAATLILPGESPQKYYDLCDEIGCEWQPKGRSELFFAEQMAVAQWKLKRIELAEYWIYRTGDPDKQLTALDRLWQAQIRQERSFARALHDDEVSPIPVEPLPAAPEPVAKTSPETAPSAPYTGLDAAHRRQAAMAATTGSPAHRRTGGTVN